MADQTKILSCPSQDELRSFNLGDLPDETVEGIAAHLSACPKCETLIETVGSDDPTLISLLQHASRRDGGMGVLNEASCHDLQSRLTEIGFSQLSAVPAARDKADLHDVTRSWASTEAENIEAFPLPEKIGRYFVLRELGFGGFARVYLARDPDKEELVAIKVPLQDRVSEKHIQGFLEEARTAAELDHAGIVRVHDWGRDKQGSCFAVMTYIEGRSLQEIKASEKLSHRKVVALAYSVADALHYAHTHGVVHRDIKPANIMIDKQGQAHVTDFGLALNENTQKLTGEELAGTVPYMSPEQLNGDRAQIDGRTDIWSLGVVLYELLTQKRPFAGGSARELSQAILKKEPKAPRQFDDEIPVEFEKICLRALSKDKGDRYSTAREFADDLKPWVSPAKSKRRLVAVGSLVAALLVVAAAVAGSKFLPTIAGGGGSDDFQPKPLLDMDLLERRPTELVNEQKDAWHYDKGKRLIEVGTRNGLIMLEVNRTKLQPYRLEVRFQDVQPADPMRGFSFGVFFGLHEDQLPEGMPCEKYQILRLVRPRNSDQYALERIDGWYYVNKFGSLVTGDAEDIEAVEKNVLVRNDKKDVLTLEVGPRGLEHVTWRGQEMRGLTTPEINQLTKTSDYEGAMGIVIQGGHAKVGLITFRFLEKQE